MRKVKKTGQRLLGYVFRRQTAIVLMLAIIIIGFGFIITKIPPGAAQSEIDSTVQASSIQGILEDPVNAPYKIATFIGVQLSSSVRTARFVAYIFFVMTVTAFYFTIRHWHDSFTAGLATVLLASNSIVLAIGRLGIPFIMVCLWFLFLALILWQLHGSSKRSTPVLVLIATALMLYIPGAVWFLSILGIIFFTKIKSLFLGVKEWALVVGVVSGVIIMSPLIAAFAKDVDVFKEWLLLPNQFDFSQLIRDILRVPSAFLYRMPDEPLITVGRLPVFDIASGILFLIGLHAYHTKLKLDRTRVMIASAITGIILGALGQLVLAVLLLAPFAFAVAAAGIQYLIHVWFEVFPRNPYARSFGMILITIVVLFSSYYQLTRFFVVWPQAPETRNTYNQPRQLPEN